MTFLERVGSKKVSGRTLHDVARVSGLSTATISKYLNGAKVKPENEKRIIQAIEECGYSVNFFAKVLKTNRSMTIGVLIPNLASTFYSSIVSEVERKLAMKGYTLFISGYDNNESQENAKFQTLVSRRVDAILVAPERSRTAQRAGKHVPRAVERHGQVLSEIAEKLVFNAVVSVGAEFALFKRNAR